jgi:hypothetical protein
LHQDLDILCLTPVPGDAEAIKQRLCQANNQFYTVGARNPNNPWTVLWYRWYSDSNRRFEKFKIDILTPGVLELPYIHPSYVVEIQTLPCAPLLLLLFHKLKAWVARRSSHRQDLRAKIPGDVRDIDDLLELAYYLGLDITEEKPYITDSFRDASYTMVRKFIREYPDNAPLFMALGLPESMCEPL